MVIGLYVLWVCMRLGLVELGVVAYLVECNGYASIGKLKEGLSGFSHCTRGVLSVEEYGEIHCGHMSIVHACRRLEGKGLIRLDCAGVRIRGLSLNYYGLGKEFLRRCWAVKSLGD